MYRPNFLNIPKIIVPQGYILRNFLKGDEEGWVDIFRECGLISKDETAEFFERKMRSHPAFLPERVFFLCKEKEFIGSASAFCHWEGTPEETGYLHMVGVKSQYQGKNFGRILSCVVLDYFSKNGFTDAVLQTDDERIPAIVTYLNIGFFPLLINETHKIRWEKILEKLKLNKINFYQRNRQVNI